MWPCGDTDKAMLFGPSCQIMSLVYGGRPLSAADQPARFVKMRNALSTNSAY